MRTVGCFGRQVSPSNHSCVQCKARQQGYAGGSNFSFLKRQLPISPAGDRFEQEADRLAGKLHRMPAQFADRTPLHQGLTNHKSSSLFGGFGKGLSSYERTYFESRLGYDLSGVRLHNTASSASMAQSLGARAFTVGSDIAFNKGEYSGQSHRGNSLLAHEIVHVIQQTKPKPLFGYNALQQDASNVGRSMPPPAQISSISSATHIQQTPQRRESLGTDWFIESEPATSVVYIGTSGHRINEPERTVRFSLRNTHDWRVSWRGSEAQQQALTQGRIVLSDIGPVFGTRVQGRQDMTYPLVNSYPFPSQRVFNHPGHVEVFYTGRPIHPTFSTLGDPLFVSVELDIVEDLLQSTMSSETLQATYQQDVRRFRDPQASEPEIAQAFLRIAVKHGIDIVNYNKREAYNLRTLYTSGSDDINARTAVSEVQQIHQFDSELAQEIADLHHFQESVRAAGGRRAADERIQRLNLVRAALLDAFPIIGHLPGGQPTGDTLQRTIRRIEQACADSRLSLANGDIHVFQLPTLEAQTRSLFGVRNGSREDRAINSAKRAMELQQLRPPLAALALLFIPGLGPYLATIGGFVLAGFSWEQTFDVQTAARAGVRMGLETDREANRRTFWTTVETLLATISVGIEAYRGLQAIRQIAPHAQGAILRLLTRIRRQPPLLSAADESSQLLVAQIDDLLHNLPILFPNQTQLFRALSALRSGRITAVEAETIMQQIAADGRAYGAAIAADRRVEALSHLTSEHMSGMCQPARDIAAASLESRTIDSTVRIILRRHQSQYIFGPASEPHSFLTVTFQTSPPMHFLVDPTFVQFSGQILRGQTGRAGEELLRQLAETGVVRLTRDNAALYSRTLNNLLSDSQSNMFRNFEEWQTVTRQFLGRNIPEEIPQGVIRGPIIEPLDTLPHVIDPLQPIMPMGHPPVNLDGVREIEHLVLNRIQFLQRQPTPNQALLVYLQNLHRRLLNLLTSG
jgi:hypothetical protein